MRFAMVVLMMASVAWGQIPHVVDCGWPGNGVTCLSNVPAPLKCKKYEHVEHWPGRCGPVQCGDSDPQFGGLTSCNAVCTPPPPDHCVDDMHEVTEKEWQELMERLKKLEKKL